MELITMQLNKINIKSEKDYTSFLNIVDKLFNKKTKIDSVEGKYLKSILESIKKYEDVKYPLL